MIVDGSMIGEKLIEDLDDGLDLFLLEGFVKKGEGL